MKFVLEDKPLLAQIFQIVERYFVLIIGAVALVFAGVLGASQEYRFIYLFWVFVIAFLLIIIIEIKAIFTWRLVGIELGMVGVEMSEKKGKKIRREQLEYHRMAVELSQIRNHKGCFIGIEMRIKDKLSHKIWIVSEDWDDATIETLYLELKNKTNDLPSEDEQEVLKQLQIMNRSKY